jgi:hypothetical protein
MQKSMQWSFWIHHSPIYNDSVNSNKTISMCRWSFKRTSGWHFRGSHHRGVRLCIWMQKLFSRTTRSESTYSTVLNGYLFFVRFLILSKNPYLTTRLHKIKMHCSFGPLWSTGTVTYRYVLARPQQPMRTRKHKRTKSTRTEKNPPDNTELHLTRQHKKWYA